MRIAKQSLLIAILSFSFVLANATTKNNGKGGEPSLNGNVNDADSKKPVQGVTVSITGKGQEKKELVTDASGNFKANQLNPGEVTIVLEKKGYRTFKKEGVMIKEGVSLKLSLDIEETEDDDSGVFHPLLRMMDGF
jgi:hypothetical protein